MIDRKRKDKKVKKEKKKIRFLFPTNEEED
jgi:hypothetical protein